MSDRLPPATGTPLSIERLRIEAMRAKTSEKVLCDRCGAEVYRMHAVWRCPACGFKSDCCGW